MTRLGIHKKVLVKINNKMIYLILLYLIIPCFHHVNFDCGIKSIPNGRKGQIKISQNQICSNLYEKKFFLFLNKIILSAIHFQSFLRPHRAVQKSDSCTVGKTLEIPIIFSPSNRDKCDMLHFQNWYCPYFLSLALLDFHIFSLILMHPTLIVSLFV